MKAALRVLTAAAALAVLGFGVAEGAPSIAVPAPGLYTYSKEGLALSGTAAVTLPLVTIVFGNNLTYQDDILITLPGATSLAPTVTAALVTCSGAGTNAVGYVSLVPGGWKFRVTDVAGVTVGASCTFTGLAVTAPSLSVTDGSLAYQANRGLTVPTVVVDGPATSGKVIEAKTQFDITTPQKLNGIVNVYADRKVFFDEETVSPGDLPPPGGVRADTLNFSTYTSGNPGILSWTGPTVAPTAVKVTINGDFSWVDTVGSGGDANTTCDAAEFPPAIVGYPGWTIDGDSNCLQLVLTQDPPVGDWQATGYFFVPGTVTLGATDWTGSVTYAYTLSTDATVKGSTTLFWDPGAWTLNAAQVYIQYMPYGRDISRIVYAANRGVSSAAVTADVTANGSTFSCSLGTARAMTVTNLSLPLDLCVFGRGITSGKVAILLTFVARDEDIEVYSAYNIGSGDRGTVVNTSNGRSFFYGTSVTFP